MRRKNQRWVGDLSQEEFDEMVWLIADAESNISWCRHRHGQSDQDQRELDTWLRVARSYRRQAKSAYPLHEAETLESLPAPAPTEGGTE